MTIRTHQEYRGHVATVHDGPRIRHVSDHYPTAGAAKAAGQAWADGVTKMRGFGGRRERDEVTMLKGGEPC